MYRFAGSIAAGIVLMLGLGGVSGVIAAGVVRPISTSGVAVGDDATRMLTGYVSLPRDMGFVTAAPSSNVLFLNRCAGGCLLTPGFDDSRLNQSSIIGETTQIAEYPWGDESWDRVVACVSALYSPFGIVVTDKDPGMADHFSAIVAGSPEDVGFPENVGGVSPFDCGIIDNAITFTFAASLGNAVQRTCEIIGQESAHAFGLDHELECQDPLTYLSGCGNKCFQDADALCGENMERECSCGGRTQNSYAFLNETFGKGQETREIRVLQPAEGTTVPAGFNVRVQPVVNCLRSVEVRLVRDGVETSLGSINGWPYVFDAPDDFAGGPVAARILATDFAGDILERTIEFEVAGKAPTAPDAGVGPGPGTCTACNSAGGSTYGRGGCSASGRPTGVAVMSVMLMLFGLLALRVRRPMR